MLRNHVSKGDIIIPRHKYFVLGDNRDNSLDSCYWGFLDASDVLGKALFIYASSAPLSGIRWNRIFRSV